jgi:hypothetical protein
MEDSDDIMKDSEALRMNSTLLSSLPWHTGVIRDYERFSGSIFVDRTMEVSGLPASLSKNFI